MRLGQVGHGELTVFFEARVTELREVLLPVPHLVALCWITSCFVVQANFNDAVNVAQALLQFKIWMTVQTSFKGGNDLVFVESGAPRPTHCQNKRPTKFFVVGSIERLNFFKFLVSQDYTSLRPGVQAPALAAVAITGKLKRRNETLQFDR